METKTKSPELPFCRIFDIPYSDSEIVQVLLRLVFEGEEIEVIIESFFDDVMINEIVIFQSQTQALQFIKNYSDETAKQFLDEEIERVGIGKKKQLQS